MAVEFEVTKTLVADYWDCRNPYLAIPNKDGLSEEISNLFLSYLADLNPGQKLEVVLRLRTVEETDESEQKEGE